MPYDLTRLQRDIAQIQHDAAGFGTGRLVAENLILTAAHLLWNKDTGTGPFLHEWQVRLERDRGKGAWRFRRGNRVTWHDAARDLALIELVEPAGGPLRPELHLRVATASGNNPHSVEARGYPRASKEMGPRKLALASGDLDAVGEDEPLRLGVRTSDLPNNPHEDWPGMSGSAVLLRDWPDPETIWVFGVAQAVPANFDGQLRVARLADAWQDAIFRRLLVAAGAPDMDAEDPTVGAQTVSQQLAELKALFQREIAATTAEYRVPREVVDRLLVTVGLAGTEPAAIPGVFDELVRRFAAMRDALQQQRNDDPEIATLKQQASDALAAADLDTAERLLSAIRARQRTLSERRRRAADEAHADLLAALEDEAATCARQADAALLRLDIAAAQRFYQDGIEVLADGSAEIRWRYALAAAGALREFGDRAGRNDALLGSLGLYGLALRDADRDRVPLDWATTQNNLGNALTTLGERESGTGRLEEAVAACRAALEERTRDRGPLDWATTQNNLGNALWRLGERESGTARLEEAVAAYRAALEEWTRDRGPLGWAGTQNNLGNALWRLGERESGTARLEEAVAAHRSALEERARDRVPLHWAMTQNNLGTALRTLGERETGTARLEEAVAVYRAALEEWTRDRVPLDWATTQNNLGNALWRLGERESGTARLEEAVAAYRAALEEWTRDRVPLDWAMTQNNLGNALRTLGERESGTARLEEAVAAYRVALAELTRDRVPLQWAATQNNLGNALRTLGERESGTGRLEEAVSAFRAALEERTCDRVPLQWAMTQNNLGAALRALGERGSGIGRLEEGVAAWNACLTVAAAAWPPEWVQDLRSRIDKALAEIGRRSAI